MNTKYNSNLEWQAFRFAASELSAEEAAQFELRLADDQEAREALARAVEMGQLLAHVPASDWQAPVELSARRERTWLHYAAWAMVGAAACLAAVMIAGKFGGENNRLAPTGSPELAEAWSRGFSETLPSNLEPAEAEPNASEALADMSVGEEVESSEPEAVAAPAPVAVPSWMVAAVAKDDGGPNSEGNNSDVRIE